MPQSYSIYKQEIKIFLNKIFSSLESPKILDVGPGIGTYAQLTPDHPMDCLEVFEPYIHNFNLNSIYKNVILGDVRTFDFRDYDFMIMGDILEHLSIKDATAVMNKVKEHEILCLVAVPYLYKQGPSRGNIHEIHLQPDLTPKLMKERYPDLQAIYEDTKYGYYVNFNPTKC